MRFVARIFSLFFLVFAVIAGLVDAIQSVAAGQPILTSMMDSWAGNSPDTLALVETMFSAYLPGWVWDPGVAFVLARPAFAVFLLFSLIFYLAGYRRARPAGRFAA